MYMHTYSKTAFRVQSVFVVNAAYASFILVKRVLASILCTGGALWPHDIKF